MVAIASLTDPNARSYQDNTIVKGVLYEYGVVQRIMFTGYPPSFHPYPPSSWVASGVEVPLQDSPGTVLLLVDQTMATSLARSLNLFERNLIGAGWKIVRSNVNRDTNTVGGSGSASLTSDPRPTKQVITQMHAAHPDLKAVVLIGRVTIPFSGSNSPDGHGTRAHSSDAYYADTDETWGDTINHASAVAPKNIPGDLRWDVVELATGRELMVGRIDMAGLTLFSETETQLLDRYFHKNHAFRHGQLVATKQGFWTINNPHPTTTIANITSYFGESKMTSKSSNAWSTVTDSASYLWGVAGATGTVQSTTGISTTQMTQSDYKVVFSAAGCSYMMETWRNNSAIRGLIAMPTWGIGSIVSHAYYGEILHPGFSMGRPLGEINTGPRERFSSFHPTDANYEYIQKSIHADLHGDPTVPMYVTPPPSNLEIVADGADAVLSWNASPAANLLGYHVYRSEGWSSPFARLSTTPVTGTGFRDSTPRSGDVIYMVRAVNLETRGTGTYIAASQGIFAPFNLSGVSNMVPTALSANITLIQDTTVLVNPQGTDPENDPLTPVIVRPPTRGKLVLEGTGYRYIPKTNFSGSDSFEFVVNDGYQDSPKVTSNITVNIDPLGLSPVPVTAMSRTGNEIQGLTVNGGNIPRSRLQTGTLTSFACASAAAVLSPNGSTPTSGSQTTGYLSDYSFETGLINPTVDATAITLTFSPPLINGPGPDLVVLEINGSAPPDPFQARINGITREVAAAAYGNTGISTASAMIKSTRNAGNTADLTVTTLAALSAAPLRVSSININQAVYGVALNLSNFGIVEGASVSSIQLGSTTGTNFDPVFVAGIIPANQAPVAVAAPTPPSGEAPISVTWSGAASTDPDGTISSYAWTFSDGGTATGLTANRVYTQPGTYSATLTVTDNQGATATHTASITVQPATTTTRGTSIPWLVNRFGTSADYEVVDATDHDGDGQPTWLEYRAGTNPQNGADSFRIVNLTVNGNGSVTLEWRGSSEHGVTTPFRVLASSNLLESGWQVREESVPRAAIGNTIWTDAAPPSGSKYFYKIEAP